MPEGTIKRGSDALRAHRAEQSEPEQKRAVPRFTMPYAPPGRAASPFHGSRMLNPADGSAGRGGFGRSMRHYGQKRGI